MLKSCASLRRLFKIESLVLSVRSEMMGSAIIQICTWHQVSSVRFQPSRRPKNGRSNRKKMMNTRTSNIERPTSNNVFCQFKKKARASLLRRNGCEGRERIYPTKFDSAELVAGCCSVFYGSFVLKSIKRSVINIQCSMLGVRCSTFNPFAVPVKRNLIRSLIKVSGCTPSSQRPRQF